MPCGVARGFLRPIQEYAQHAIVEAGAWKVGRAVRRRGRMHAHTGHAKILDIADLCLEFSHEFEGSRHLFRTQSGVERGLGTGRRPGLMPRFECLYRAGVAYRQGLGFLLAWLQTVPDELPLVKLCLLFIKQCFGVPEQACEQFNPVRPRGIRLAVERRYQCGDGLLQLAGELCHGIIPVGDFERLLQSIQPIA